MRSPSSKTLLGRKLYIPQMSYEGARCMAAAFQSIGVDAQPAPSSDARTYELARKYLSGDECLPEAVTLGDFLKVTQQPDYDPAKTAFLLPTSNGPCRFGHYLPLARKVFRDRGEEELLLLSPSSSDGYEGIGAGAMDLVRTGWRAMVVADVLRKMLLKTRPYEQNPGTTDKVFSESLDRVCDAIAVPKISHSQRIKEIIRALVASRDAFRSIPTDRSQKRLLIGIIGEIFCRLNDFSNDYLIRLIEKHGGEVWMSDISEWVWYTNDEERVKLIRQKQSLSFRMLGCRLKHAIMHSDEQKLLTPFGADFVGYEEPGHITEILERSRPYLPREGSHGEMVINVGKTIWLCEKGAAGVIDVSPFTCMNGIVCEAVYPRLSKEHNGFPVRIFYFDGLQSNAESDVQIFMELAQNYRLRKGASLLYQYGNPEPASASLPIEYV
jgi:predicted nucleotide-binding protein (sugar kinase/HSP70/actin superfamily)